MSTNFDGLRRTPDGGGAQKSWMAEPGDDDDAGGLCAWLHPLQIVLRGPLAGQAAATPTIK